ncbi:3836_t:CDS:2, partial [Cetraspora pellucida]
SFFFAFKTEFQNPKKLPASLISHKNTRIDSVNNNNPTHPVNNDSMNPVNNDLMNSVNNDHTDLQPLLQSLAKMYQVWPLHQQITIQSQLEELINIPPVILEEPVTSKL